MRLRLQKRDIFQVPYAGLSHQIGFLSAITGENETHICIVLHSPGRLEYCIQPLCHSMRPGIENGKAIIPAEFGTCLRARQRAKFVDIDAICQEKNTFGGKTALDKYIANTLRYRPYSPGSLIRRPLQPFGQPA